jgi:hypothetical protein
MKLQIAYEFELEVGDDKYTGTFIDPTKKQLKEIDKLAPTKELKELEKVERKLSHKADPSMWARREELLDIVDGFDSDDLFKERLAISVKSEDFDAIMKVGEDYGYKRVFDTIIKDIAERREGN